MTLDVYIKLTTGRVFHMPVPESQTVGEVCELVAKEEGVSGRCLRLKYTGKVLNKDHTMAYLGVRPETILKADVIKPKSITIQVQYPSGTTSQLQIQNITSLNEIIARAKDKEGASNQTNTTVSSKLLLKGKPLVGPQTLAQDHGIEEGTLVELSERTTSDNIEEPVAEELDQATLDELLANFADGMDRDRKVEVVFSFDTTGSMYESLTEVRSKLDSTVTRLLHDIPNIRIGIMSHGDYCDQQVYVVRSIDLTSDTNKLVDYINNVPCTGGEGPYACYEWVLHKAQSLSWSEDAAKALVMIGDVHPHAITRTDQCTNWHKELQKLCDKQIKVYGVQVRDVKEAERFYCELADKSGGAYIKFKHFNYLTDMFLAVCYREAGERQLQQFAEEVEEEGRMTGELTDMFQQLEKPTETGVGKAASADGLLGTRYLAEPWWDPKLPDDSEPIYTYDASEDIWSYIDYTNRPITSRLQHSLRVKKNKFKNRCKIM